jgi:hypothetical protein
MYPGILVHNVEDVTFMTYQHLPVNSMVQMKPDSIKQQKYNKATKTTMKLTTNGTAAKNTNRLD